MVCLHQHNNHLEMVVCCLCCLLAHLTCKSALFLYLPALTGGTNILMYPLKPGQMFILPSLLWHMRLELVPPYASGLPAPHRNQWERIWWIGYMSLVPLELVSRTSAIPFRSANCFQYPCANIESDRLYRPEWSWLTRLHWNALS